MINNIEKVKSLLNFENPGKFSYKMFIIRRKKDCPDAERDIILKEYHIKKEEDYEKCIKKAIELASLYNARVYIELEKRCLRDIGFKLLHRLGQILASGYYEGISDKLISSASSLGKNIGKEYFMIDYDIKDIEESEMKAMINYLKINNLLIEEIKTLNGMHYITEKFDIKRTTEVLMLSSEMVKSIKKSPTTLLYCNLKQI